MLNQSVANGIFQLKGLAYDLIFNFFVDLDLVGLSNLDHT